MDEYETEPLPELETDREQSDTTVLTTGVSTLDSAVTREQCSNGDCPNEDPDPMEAVWTELMSPVAVPDQRIGLQPAPGTTQPDPGRFGEILSALRPEGIDDHAVQTIRSTWGDVAVALDAMPARLMSALASLAEAWAGDDFDLFAEEVEQVRDNLYDTVDEIYDAYHELEEFEGRVYTLQGGGYEVPFPAARVWKADDGIVDGPKIHVRPVWAIGGDCDKDRDEGDNWEALGLPRDSGDDLRGLVAERAQHFIEQGMDPGTAQQRAQEDYEASQAPFFTHWSDTMQLAAETHNLGIGDLRDQVVDAQETPVLDAAARPQTESSADEIIEPLPELEPGPVPQPPPLGGLEQYTPPEQQGVPDFPPPRSDWSPADYGGTGTSGGSGGIPGDWERSADEANPWVSSTENEDEVSGGLASGGIGAGPGGFGGAGAPSGAGTGGMGGMLTGPMAAPAGSGAAARPASARPGSARPSTAGAPGARGTGTEGSEEGRETWLKEDEDVWGIVAEDDDPYA